MPIPKFSNPACIALIPLLFSACSLAKDSSRKTPHFPESKKAPANITESLNPAKANTESKESASSPEFPGTNGSSITLKRSSLGKAFLLSMSVTTSAQSARSNILLPKVVAFALNGSELALLEQNIYSIYSEIPNAKLLQTFPVESQDAENITFKWAYGLASIPVKSFSASSDDKTAVENQVSESETTYPVVASYLKYARIRNNRLEMRQVARVRSSELTPQESNATISTKEESLQLDIAFTPYVPNPGFHPRLSTKLKGVGFFEVAQVRKEEGDLDIYATRWDLSPEAGPITYAISKNAPPEAVNAMREGVEYWNEAARAVLNRDILKVELNADPEAPPGPRRVLIYWVPYSSAGAAYANFQPDPLTGEITSGFVYLPSSFYLSGRKNGRRFVNQGVENASKPNITPVGFRTASLCHFTGSLLRGIDPLADGMDEKIGQKMGLDYLRFVVAHEVGHTLGLRHNFAGSIASEFASPSDAREKFREYLRDEHHTGAVASSSLMDYTTFRDTVLEGAAIGAKKAFPYDRAAIAWAYSKKEISMSELNPPPYCPDQEARHGNTFGCAVGDSSQKPLAGYAEELARSRLLAANGVIEAILVAIRPENPNDALTVQQALIQIHPDSASLDIITDATEISRTGGPGMNAISVDRSEQGSNWTNKEEYADKTMDYFRKEFEFANGLPGILRTAYGLDDNFKVKRGWLLADVRAKLKSLDLRHGKTLGGKPFELSDLEIRDLKAATEKLAAATENAMLRDLLLAVTGLDPKKVSEGKGKTTLSAMQAYSDSQKFFEKSVVQDSWQNGLQAIAEQLATGSETELEGTVDGNAVKVPAPLFPLEARVAAMRLFAPKVFGRTPETWLRDAHAQLLQSMITRMSPVLKVLDDGKTEPSGKTISKELQEWAKQELAVLTALKAAR